MSLRIVRVAIVAMLGIAVIDACSEQVSGALGCPTLCTDESAQLRDTTLLAAIVVDSALDGYPQFGETHDVALLNLGDSADVRLGARFDTLPSHYTPFAGGDSAIARVDSAQLIFVVDTTRYAPVFPLTIEAFDIDTVGVDSVTKALVPLYRSDRLLGYTTFNAGDFKDTVKLSLSNAKLFAKIRDTLRLRVGLKISGPASRKLVVLSSFFNPRLRFRAAMDTLVHPDTVFPASSTPTDNLGIRNALTVFTVMAKGAQPAPATGRIAIGGLSGSRPYYRFDFPPQVVDSVQVIRASLLLTQTPARPLARVKDSLTVYAQPILASTSVTDLRAAYNFIGSAFAYGVDSTKFFPSDSGVRSIELVNLVRYWRAAGTVNSTRSLVLRAAEEGGTPGEALFYSLEAASNLRPRIRLTYVPRRGFGLP